MKITSFSAATLAAALLMGTVNAGLRSSTHRRANQRDREATCEGKGHSQSKCATFGCCAWDDGQCWAADGTCSTIGGGGNGGDSDGGGSDGGGSDGGGGNGAPASSCWTATFDKKANVFGVMLYGTAGVKESTLMHAAKVVAQYLDNDEDGVVDDAAVVASLVAEKASMVIFETDSEASSFFANKFDSCGGPTVNVQDLYQSEMIGGGGTGLANGIYWDASIEEIMHLIQYYGWSKVYPDLSPKGATRLTRAMDTARGGKFTEVPDRYPAKAWYTYDDKTCDYQCLAVEYFYWALTSYLGHLSSHCTDIDNEWDLCTKSLVMSKDPAVTAIITDSKYGLPTVLPDTTYNGGIITVTESTAQDVLVKTGGNGGGPSPTPPVSSPTTSSPTTSPPTKVPTKQATPNPTTEPPTPGPANCEIADWYFVQNNGNTRDCSWIGKKPNRRCNKNGGFGECTVGEKCYNDPLYTPSCDRIRSYIACPDECA